MDRFGFGKVRNVKSQLTTEQLQAEIMKENNSLKNTEIQQPHNYSSYNHRYAIF